MLPSGASYLALVRPAGANVSSRAIAGRNRKDVESRVTLGGFAADPLYWGSQDTPPAYLDCHCFESTTGGRLVARAAARRHPDFGLCGPRRQRTANSECAARIGADVGFANGIP